MGDADNTQIIMSVEEIEQWMDDALNEMDDGLSSLFSFMQVLNERTLRIVSEVATWQKFRRCFSALSMFVIPTVLAIGLSYGTIETANRYSNLQAALQSVITFLMYLSWSIGFPVYIYTLWEAYFSDFTTKHIFIHRTSSTDRDSELDDDSTRARCDDSSLILPFMEGSFERFSELGRLVSQRARNNIRSELERRANGAREAESASYQELMVSGNSQQTEICENEACPKNQNLKDVGADLPDTMDALSEAIRAEVFQKEKTESYGVKVIILNNTPDLSVEIEENEVAEKESELELKNKTLPFNDTLLLGNIRSIPVETIGEKEIKSFGFKNEDDFNTEQRSPEDEFGM